MKEGATAKPPTVARPSRFKVRRYLGWLKVLPVLLVVALVARQRFVAPLTVHRFVVDKGDVAREVFGRSTIESRREVQLGFDLVGRISDVLVDEGDRVKLGQVVAHLEPTQVNAEVRAASSGVSLAKAAIARLSADERRSQATLTLAEQDAVRIRTLASSGSVSARDLDLAEQQLALAQADLGRVRASQVEAQREIAVATGATESKAATVARAVLMSPFDGVVIRRFKDPGDTVVVGSTVLRVVAVDRLWARATLDESSLADLREGMPTEITLFGQGGEPLRGTIDRIGSEVDRQTHEVLVDVLLARAPSRLAIGQRADVRITVEQAHNVARIPLAFVHRESAGPFVFVDAAGRVARQPVQLGIIGRDTVAVMAGLNVGDVVLSSVVPGAALAAGRRWSSAP